MADKLSHVPTFINTHIYIYFAVEKASPVFLASWL